MGARPCSCATTKDQHPTLPSQREPDARMGCTAVPPVRPHRIDYCQPTVAIGRRGARGSHRVTTSGAGRGGKRERARRAKAAPRVATAQLAVSGPRLAVGRLPPATIGSWKPKHNNCCATKPLPRTWGRLWPVAVAVANRARLDRFVVR